MPTTGNLDVSEGYVSATVPANGYIDAGRSGDIAGIEFEVSRLRVGVGTNANERHADLLVTLDLHPGTAEQLMLAIADKISHGGAFTSREWALIADALDYAASQSARDDFRTQCRAFAARIREAKP